MPAVRRAFCPGRTHAPPFLLEKGASDASKLPRAMACVSGPGLGADDKIGVGLGVGSSQDKLTPFQRAIMQESEVLVGRELVPGQSHAHPKKARASGVSPGTHDSPSRTPNPGVGGVTG